MLTVEKLREWAMLSLRLPWGCGNAFLSQISPMELQAPYLRFLHLLAMEIRPQAILECGVYMGTATGHMAYGNPSSIVIGIDIDFHDHAFLVERQFSNISLIQGDTRKAVPVVRDLLNGKRIGILFLDSAHDGTTPMQEFEMYEPFFANECIVACDDIAGNNLSARDQAAMQEFWAWMPGFKTELNFLHPEYAGVGLPGFGVSIVR